MKKFKLLVVLYKESICSAATLNSIKKTFTTLFNQAEFDLFIWDNSPEPQRQHDILDFKNNCHGLSDLKYHHDQSNRSLSHVYNTILADSIHHDYVILLDQDSVFNDEFIVECMNVAEQYSPELILPVIKFKNIIVSPSEIFYLKGSYFPTSPHGFVSIKKLSAINSGMVISTEYVKMHSFKYHISLKNYCTDDFFMREFRKNGKKAYVLNYQFEHDLCLSTLNDNSEKLKERYKLMKEGRYIVYSDSITSYLSIRMYFFIHKIYMALKYKDRDYLRM